MSWKFSEIQYIRPDYEAHQARLDELTRRVREAKDFETVKGAIEEKSALCSELSAMSTVAFCRAYHDVSDPFYQEEFNELNRAEAMLDNESFAQAVLESPFKGEIDKCFGAQYCLLLQRGVSLLRHGKELQAEIGDLVNRFQQTKAQLRYDFNGERTPEAIVTQVLTSPDRDKRKAAYEALLEGVAENREPLAEMLRALVKKRNALARANGFESYIDYANLENSRFGYGHRELSAFVEDVRKHIVPLYLEIQEKQRTDLGLDVLYPYDATIYSLAGSARRVPGDEALYEAAREMYCGLSPEAGAFFEMMQQHETMDVAYSEHKIYGMGFMTGISGKWQMPYVFANSNGTSSDVSVYTHELGHAYQTYLTMQNQMYEYSQGSPDFHEIHSKTMELLSYPYAELFFGQDAERFLAEHKCDIVKEMCAYCQRYAFESWLYQNEDASLEEWAVKFNAVAHEFGRSLHNEQWEEKLRQGATLLDDMAVFAFPLYVVSYALSEVCALELYDEYSRDPAAGWAKYRAISACGSSKSYQQTLEDAGLSLPYAPGIVEKTAKRLRAMIFGA